MLSYAKPSIALPAASKRVFVAFAAKQEHFHVIWQLASRSTQSSAGKKLGDAHPLFQTSQFKYSSDSYLQRDFKDDNLYERYSRMGPQNTTKDAATMTLQEDQVAYDEDYDQYYSHMSPSSMKNQDIEKLDGAVMTSQEDQTYDEDYDRYYSHMSPSLMKNQDVEQIDAFEMIQHDDVEPSEFLRINYESGNSLEEETAMDGPLSYVRRDLFEADSDYMELEEDWEIMHQSIEEKSGCSEVYDNIDDVNDIVQ